MNVGSASAVVCGSDRSIEVSEVGLAPLGPDQVLVRRQCSGVSTGTDRWVMSGRFGWAELPPPLVPGYQAYGVIEALGAEVEGLMVGQSVFTTSTEPYADVSSAWGGHASLGITAAREVYDATDVPGQRAALCVTAQVGYNAASRLPLEPGARVAIFGDGIIGASAALSARLRGFEVTIIGRHHHRLQAVEAPGIATMISNDDTAGHLRDLAPHGVIDTVQNLAAFDTYVDAFAPGAVGQLVYSGHAPDGTTSWGDMARLQQRQLSVHFVSGWTRQRVETVLGLMRDGQMEVDQLVGVVAADPPAITSLMSDVAAGRHRALASIIDWSRS